MKILDLDMDYFMDRVATDIQEEEKERLSEQCFIDSVWEEHRVRKFLEEHLGLSKVNKIRGRIVTGHNEALFWWKELIDDGKLMVPFEVVHVDSHADLGLGSFSSRYILEYLLQYSVEERPLHSKFVDYYGRMRDVGIGDYLLFAIAFRWISKLTYCANPKGDKNDYLWEIMKNLEEEPIWDEPVENTIQLVCNPDMPIPYYDASPMEKKEYLDKGIKEPEVPFLIIPNVEDVAYDGDFDFVVLAQSPNYTPENADFIMEILREYIEEC